VDVSDAVQCIVLGVYTIFFMISGNGTYLELEMWYPTSLKKWL